MPSLTPVIASRSSPWYLVAVCPFLAAVHTTAHAMVLALVTVFVVLASSVGVAALRRIVPPALRRPASMLIIATFTTIASLCVQAFAFDIHSSLALYISLAAVSTVTLLRIDMPESNRAASLLDTARISVGFGVALVAFGTLREFIGHGTLLARFDVLETGFLVVALPPGAFFVSAVCLALARGRST